MYDTAGLFEIPAKYNGFYHFPIYVITYQDKLSMSERVKEIREIYSIENEVLLHSLI